MKGRRIKLEEGEGEGNRQLWALWGVTLGTVAVALWWSLGFLTETWTCVSTGASGSF